MSIRAKNKQDSSSRHVTNSTQNEIFKTKRNILLRSKILVILHGPQFNLKYFLILNGTMLTVSLNESISGNLLESMKCTDKLR